LIKIKFWLTIEILYGDDCLLPLRGKVGMGVLVIFKAKVKSTPF
jgi:hypothetical protein